MARLVKGTPEHYQADLRRRRERSLRTLAKQDIDSSARPVRKTYSRTYQSSRTELGKARSVNSTARIEHPPNQSAPNNADPLCGSKKLEAGLRT